MSQNLEEEEAASLRMTIDDQGKAWRAFGGGRLRLGEDPERKNPIEVLGEC
jgi:hypothetical protein